MRRERLGPRHPEYGLEGNLDSKWAQPPGSVCFYPWVGSSTGSRGRAHKAEAPLDWASGTFCHGGQPSISFTFIPSPVRNQGCAFHLLFPICPNTISQPSDASCDRNLQRHTALFHRRTAPRQMCCIEKFPVQGY